MSVTSATPTEVAVTPDDRLRHRIRLLTWSSVLVALAFAQSPGRLVTDTKVDLVVDPVGFLGRALSAWDPEQTFGQVQNQAYGYFFPMGPFFAVGDGLGLPGWVVQRAWWSLILVVAFLGAVRLAGLLGVRRPSVQILVGLAFALSPRMLSVIGPSSIEMWPTAVAPWVLIPLVVATRTGRAHRGAVLSALAVGAVGGVNAVATFAVIPLAGLWILLGATGRVRRLLLLWWPPAVLAATLWWLLPLFVLGGTAPPFLDFIESSAVSTSAGTPLDALRGSSNWVPYIDPSAVAGRAVIDQPILIFDGLLIAAIGLAGLALPRVRHRSFLLAGAALGWLLLTAGHTGAVQGWGADAVQNLLDGALAPLRNTHKFDVVLRLPLVIGLGLAIDAIADRLRSMPDHPERGSQDRRFIGGGLALVILVALGGATAPAWTGQLAPRGTFAEIPPYWREAAAWLGDRESRDRAQALPATTLLTPATAFGDYLWGRTGDEPLQPLAASPWAIRNAVPLTPGATIQQLDALSDAFVSGRGDVGLASSLLRAGIGLIVVRNDLDRTRDVLPPDLVRATLLSTPGVRRVAAFGPTLEQDAVRSNDRTLTVLDRGWRADRRALEVFEIDGASGTARLVDGPLATVVGDASSLGTLDRLGLTRGSDVIFAPDVPAAAPPTGPLILTDGHRRTETRIGAVDQRESASLTLDESWRVDRRSHSYDAPAVAPWLSVPDLRGADSIVASSSASDADALPYPDPSAGPWAAFDGDPTTTWSAHRAASAERASLTLRLDRPTDLGRITLAAPGDGGRRQMLTVTTEAGPVRVRVGGGEVANIEVGRVDELRITGRSTRDEPMAIVDVTGDRLTLSRPLVLPALPKDYPAPSAIVLSRSAPTSIGCLTYDAEVRCRPDRYLPGEEGRVLDRELSLPAASDYTLQVQAVARGGPELDTLLQQGGTLAVGVTSQESPTPAGAGWTLVDGDRSTVWMATTDDISPVISIDWIGARPIDRLRLVAAGPQARPVGDVIVTFRDGSQVERPVGADGTVTFAPTTTDGVRIQLLPGLPRTSIDVRGVASGLPIGLADVEIPGVPGLPRALGSAVRDYGCGSGPTVTIDGREVLTALRARPTDLVAGVPVAAEPCGMGSAAGSTRAPMELDRGTHRIVATGTAAVRPDTVLLRQVGSGATGVAAANTTESTIVTTHATNPGWEGTLGSTRGTPLVVNGWQQGYRVPASADGPLLETFAPNQPYRGGLIVGVVAVLVLLGVALRVRREPAVPREQPGSLDRPSSPCERWPARVSVAAIATAAVGWGGLLAGGSGAITVVVGGALVVIARRFTASPATAPVIAAATVSITGVAAALRPWGRDAAWSGDLVGIQLPALAAAGVLVAALADASLRRRKARAHDIAGRSTPR